MLEVPVDNMSVVLGDTDIVIVGGGSHSGRSTRHAATVMAMACSDLLDEGRRPFAAKLDTAPETCRCQDLGRYLAVPGTNHTIDLFALARETEED